ncbi:MAG: energy transducer TonB [Flavobacteriales bacterium]|nr:energy transducer TonB [Flavobacteriales bacterium]
MKNFLKILDIFNNRKVFKPKSKKDASINFNSTLFFQLGLIVSIISIALIINATYGEAKKTIASPLPYDNDEPFLLNDFIILKPVIPEVVVEEKFVTKKIIIDVIKVVKKPTFDESNNVLVTEPLPVIVDKAPTIITSPARVIEEPKAYLAMGVERAPIFPGCESLTNNKARIDCMSGEIGKIINRRFDKNIAGDIGLSGQQRIYVTFTIDKTGEVVDIKVRAPHPRLEKEAIKVINLIPKMLPGIQSDRNVDVLFSLPIILDVT